MKTIQQRYKQAAKEAKWAILLTIAYLVWWYVSAYALSEPAFAPASMPKLYFGLPLWFLVSCIVGPVLFTLLCALMIKVFYRDISLEIEQEHDND